jgi:hypothetical protein
LRDVLPVRAKQSTRSPQAKRITTITAAFPTDAAATRGEHKGVPAPRLRPGIDPRPTRTVAPHELPGEEGTATQLIRFCPEFLSKLSIADRAKTIIILISQCFLHSCFCPTTSPFFGQPLSIADGILSIADAKLSIGDQILSIADHVVVYRRFIYRATP